ncbi:MAG TPA: multidrug effflux MFS transporter [Candidatus Aphodousia gallistercoris]|nr:multidrug effflux MFS transporter [Candidatus Aphodousia gallistercoris]
MFSVPKSLAALLSVCSMVGPLSANTYMPGLSSIGAEFAVSEVATYQTLSGYLTTFAISSLFVGAVSDSLGRRAVMIGGMLLYALSCAICALSPGFEVFLFGRIMMGLFASAGTVLAMAVTRDLFEGRQAQEMTSLIAIIFALAPAFAPIIGGWLVLLWGWRSVFYFLALFAFSMAVICFFFLKETHPKEKRTAFHVVPLVTSYAKAMTNKAFAAGVVCNGFVFMGSILFSAGAPDYVENIMQMGVTDFGYLMLPLIGFSVLGSVFCTKLTARFGDVKTVNLQILMMYGAGIIGVLLNYGMHVPYPLCLFAVIVYSVAMSVVRPIMTVFNLDYFPENRGMAASIQQFFQTSAFAICAAFWVPIVMGSAWKYDAVLLLCGVVVSLCWWIVLKTRPGCLPKGFVPKDTAGGR